MRCLSQSLIGDVVRRESEAVDADEDVVGLGRRGDGGLSQDRIVRIQTGRRSRYAKREVLSACHRGRRQDCPSSLSATCVPTAFIWPE